MPTAARNVRRLAGLGVAVTLLLLLVPAPGARTQGIDETCALTMAKFDPAVINTAFPDDSAQYYTGVYQLIPGMRIRISGEFPHARYMSFNVYDPLLRPLDGITDVKIVPDPGRSNPFVEGADRTGSSRRSYTVFIDFGAPPAHRAPNTLYTGAGQNGLPNVQGTFIYRIYIPDRGRDDTGGVGLPTVTIEPTTSTGTPAPSPCANIAKPTVSGINELLAAQSTPADLPLPGGTNPPTWRKFVNLASSLAVNLVGSPNPGGIDLDALGGSGGFLSNKDNAYVSVPINRGTGQIVVTRFRAPTFPNTRPGAARMPGGDLRYWSMCQNDPLTQRVIACLNDDRAVLSKDGNVTFVVSTPGARPPSATAACGANWIPWGLNPRAVLIYRNMLPNPTFAQSIQLAKVDHEAATMGNYLPVSTYYANAAAYERAVHCTTPAAPLHPGGGGGGRHCPRATGGLKGRTLGLVRLGMTRGQVRKVYKRSIDRRLPHQDYFCLTPNGIRVWYASPKLLKGLSRRVRSQISGRVMVTLTANAHYTLRGIRPGATLAAARRALAPRGPFHVGRNDWYLAPNGPATAILKVRRGIVQEIGIADKRLTATRSAAKRFLTSFS